MTHATEKFKFIDVDGKEVEFESVPYSFSIAEDVLEKRFGNETIEKYAKDHVLDFQIKLEHIKNDFPKLLKGDFSKISWRDQGGEYYDNMKRVYCFFLDYDSNVQLRLSEQLKETLALNIKNLETILHSMPENISEMVKGKNTINN